MQRILCCAGAILLAWAVPEMMRLEEENAALLQSIYALGDSKAVLEQNELSAMAAIVTEMTKPVLLGDFDRLGFIRLKKVGSTTLHHFLSTNLFYENCKLSSCLYGTGVKTFACPEHQKEEYQCSHGKPYFLESRFQEEKAAWLATPSVAEQQHEIAQSRLYKVIVMRDPATRIVSDYFYTLKGQWVPEKFQVWIDRFPEAYKAIEDKDFRKYVQAPNDNLNDMTLQMARSASFGQVADEALFVEALGELRRCKLVLLTEYMPQGMMMLEHIMGVQVKSPEHYSMRVRESAEDPERVKIEKDEELMNLARQGGWADQALYEEAKRMFFSAWVAFMEILGDPVEDLEQSLAKYAKGPPAPVADQGQQAATAAKTEL